MDIPLKEINAWISGGECEDGMPWDAGDRLYVEALIEQVEKQEKLMQDLISAGKKVMSSQDFAATFCRGDAWNDALYAIYKATQAGEGEG